MTEYCRRMLNDEENDAPGKCRERRRRRIERRRSAVMSQGNRPDSKRLRFSEPAATSSSSEDLESTGEAPIREPVFGTMSISGRSRHMEDAISVRTMLCRPDSCRREPVHFFSVYDGHGGPHVAELCREMMHVFLVEELNRLEGTHGGPAGEEGSVSCSAKEGEENENVTEMEEEYLWRKVMEKSFEKMDKAAIKAYPCSGVGLRCGSTAVVAVLTPDHIVVANCGDSRAVLCRGGGRAIPLSHDHKPDRSDERARIEGAGGRVIYVNGARVEGILAMSRAIGDQYLKPIVTSEPEVTFTKREAEDECLIIASDGLWDVLSSELACEVARECLREGALAVRSTSTMDSKTSTTTTTGPQSEDVTGNGGPVCITRGSFTRLQPTNF
ncbi:probable protein phosphatase 2C 75 isoform X2 [Humulus lupulus]|uniref:probable protein phosphatase 2C 75 isoform X2 n=1 Tax=Humulus lupulus TaxID=3486 RepID=UPI002B41462A|nr:probable protein phosphatase 2C 75 isoform X2 [Humulus lupulus]